MDVLKMVVGSLVCSCDLIIHTGHANSGSLTYTYMYLFDFRCKFRRPGSEATEGVADFTVTPMQLVVHEYLTIRANTAVQSAFHRYSRLIRKHIYDNQPESMS